MQLLFVGESYLRVGIFYLRLGRFFTYGSSLLLTVNWLGLFYVRLKFGVVFLPGNQIFVPVPAGGQFFNFSAPRYI